MIIGRDSLRIKADGSTTWLRTEFWRRTGVLAKDVKVSFERYKAGDTPGSHEIDISLSLSCC
jgi:hypothetical protein